MFIILPELFMCHGFDNGRSLGHRPACPLPRHDGVDRGAPFEVAPQCCRQGFARSSTRLASRGPGPPMQEDESLR